MDRQPSLWCDETEESGFQCFSAMQTATRAAARAGGALIRKPQWMTFCEMLMVPEDAAPHSPRMSPLSWR